MAISKIKAAWAILICAALLLAIAELSRKVSGQELEPRTYSAAPVGTNILVVGYGRSFGDLTFDPSLPITDAKATINTTFAGYVRSINFFGRSASVGMVMPYVWGHLQGNVSGEFQEARRSGLTDPAFRFAVILKGAPAMDLKQFAAYKEKTNIGVSIGVRAPLGQYDPARVINPSANRWAFKPEIGLTHKFRRTFLDAYAGVWLYTANNNFQGRVRKQDPIFITQFHLTYIINKKMWAAFDSNFYTGGQTSVNGIRGRNLQRNSRIGGTFAYKFNRRQSIKFNYATGAYTTIGGDFQSVGFAYQYVWGRGL